MSPQRNQQTSGRETAAPDEPTIAFNAADVQRAQQARPLRRPRRRGRRRFELPRVTPRA